MNDQRAVICAVLNARGWAPTGGPCLGEKSFATAVGPKAAAAYLSTGSADDPNRTLYGQYYSEGRNALAPHGVLIPVDADDAATRTLAAQFVDRAEAAIADSYAARLLRA